jgi:hypothetical protein
MQLKKSKARMSTTDAAQYAPWSVIVRKNTRAGNCAAQLSDTRYMVFPQPSRIHGAPANAVTWPANQVQSHSAVSPLFFR